MNRDKPKKNQQVYLGEKEGEMISAIRNTVNHDSENLGLVPVLEPFCDKDSTMEQELANCHSMYDVAKYNVGDFRDVSEFKQ